MRRALFIYDSPEKNADLYYATRFRAPDAFIFFMVGRKKYAVLNDLEIDRARREARVDRILSINPYVKRAESKKRVPGQADVVHEILSERGVDALVVPRDAPYGLIAAMRKKGYKVEVGPHPFFPERLKKSAEERGFILRSQRALFAAMRMARDTLAASKIRNGRLVHRGSALTSDRLRTMINVFLLERGYLAADTIVSCGSHAVDPHDIGSGPLKARSSIIVDIFPRSLSTWYYGDATRTFCRGRAPEGLKKLYAAVKGAQSMAIGMVKAGANGRRIHEAIHERFKSKGFPTRVRKGRIASGSK